MTDNERYIHLFNQYRDEVFRLIALWDEDRDAALAELGPSFRLIYSAPGGGEYFLTFETFAESFCAHIIPSCFQYRIDLSKANDESLRLVSVTDADEPMFCKNDSVRFTTITGDEFGVVVDVPGDNDPDSNYEVPLACYRVGTSNGIVRLLEYRLWR